MSKQPGVADVVAWLSLLIAAAGAVLALIKLRSELRAGREQRDKDLRWRQAEAAKALNDEMLEDRQVGTAFRLLDYPSAPIHIDETNAQALITRSQILQALDPQIPARDPTSRTVREAFDALFYYLATMEHYVASSLILPEDVVYPLDYYYWHFQRLRSHFDNYAKWYGLTRAEAFLKHQRERLRDAVPPPAFLATGDTE